MAKFLITGGHLTPALAFIEEAQKRNHDLLYIGRISSFAEGEAPSVEGEVIKKLGIKYFGINPVKLQRDYNLKNLLSLPKFPYTVVQAANIIRKESPDVVVSFGGYVAVPFAVAAYLQKTPIVTHEQTTVVGLANRIISRIAAKIAISWEESADFFPKKKSVYTGNLIRTDLFNVADSVTKPDPNTIYITGGNQGSHILNQVVEKGLPELLSRFTVYHQVGNSPVYNDFQRLTNLHATLSSVQQKRYIVQQWFDTTKISSVFTKAGIIVGRSGANTVSEIAALGKVALFVPIPWSSHNEQTLNAQLLTNRGSAMIIPQSELNERVLLNTLETMVQHFGELSTAAQANKVLIPRNAAPKLVDVVESVVKSS